jgi:hypothetical protein
MLEIEDGRSVTQILYRDEKREFILGYIAEFSAQGITKKYKKSDPNHKYKGFMHSFKASADGVNWSEGWETHTGAIRVLLRHHKKDEIWGTTRVIPTPQIFHKYWKELDYSKKL